MGRLRQVSAALLAVCCVLLGAVQLGFAESVTDAAAIGAKTLIGLAVLVSAIALFWFLVYRFVLQRVKWFRDLFGARPRRQSGAAPAARERAGSRTAVARAAAARRHTAAAAGGRGSGRGEAPPVQQMD
eukprot:TRINITY_DN35120_c0_g1_i1.p1 TRINITY_DN35120_c0_g1~~TRINITY_DN35120_c0_g1_i1.p1  ORF type:complete len:129 (+),score=28.30 TRINITY_DN35120_c0_g1_i1:81-467(+)